MRAYVCVYLHRSPSKREWSQTALAAERDPMLAEFLRNYLTDDSFYDWGDDPAFFSATHRLGTPAGATWGVCRPNVRSRVRSGDLLIWFCAKYSAPAIWRYYFVGYATVKELLRRRQIWSERRYARYRRFYNVLARVEGNGLRQHETFHSYHRDWRRRARAPYVTFNLDPALTRLNLSSPIFVAEKGVASLVEEWRSDRDQRVDQLESVLFQEFGIQRRLRSTNPQRAHPHIALHNQRPPDGRNARQLIGGLRNRLSVFI